jgi:hypothetical protein
MDQAKISGACNRLERNLPLRGNQARLPQSLRRLHQSILRYYLQHGKAPRQSDITDFAADWSAAIDRLAADQIVLVEPGGSISGAYPFTSEERGFKVISNYGAVNAMCAFDAIAVSSMFGLPTRIESSCRISGRDIVIEQDAAKLQVIEPEITVFAAIDWHARDSTVSCSASLCTEMMFIAGKDEAAKWQDRNPSSRELFTLDEAHAFICAVFLPLMSRQGAIEKSA